MANPIRDWESVYRESEVVNLPWYNAVLDADLAEELHRRKLTNGNFLDIGTGPGTQAIHLANVGFSVTGSDISQSAIHKAKKLSSKVNFVVDDILKSNIKTGSFDYIFDRGCFHSLPKESRSVYVQTVKNILADHGILFLKTFSVKEKATTGPHKFSPRDIAKIFSKDFDIGSSKETIYQGTLVPPPKALFTVLSKKKESC